MTSWLHEERLTAVHNALRASGARTVLDLGCGDGDMLARLTQEPQIDKIVGIDLSQQALERARARLDRIPDKGTTSVTLIHGSMTQANAALTGFDCAVLVETIEHLNPNQLAALERAVFGTMRPATIIVTTPNAEFNTLLGVPTHRFRHPDHRFEWDRAKFRHWANGVAGRNHYGCLCSDIAGNHPTRGGASQMAVFAGVGTTASAAPEHAACAV